MPDRSCPACGHPLSPESHFCGHCGATIEPKAAEVAIPAPPPVEMTLPLESPPGTGSKRTVFGVTVDQLAQQSAPGEGDRAPGFGAAAPPHVRPRVPSQSDVSPAARTMIGAVAAMDAPNGPSAPAAAPAPAQRGAGTVVGVAAYTPPGVGAAPFSPALGQPAIQAMRGDETMVHRPGPTSPEGATKPLERAPMRAGGAGGTMIGVSIPNFGGQPPIASPMQSAPMPGPGGPPAEAARPPVRMGTGTIVGVQVPVIPQKPAPEPARPKAVGGTMIGVAIPGIAPSGGAAPPVGRIPFGPSGGAETVLSSDNPLANQNAHQNGGGAFDRAAPAPAQARRPMLNATVALVAPPAPFQEMEPPPPAPSTAPPRGFPIALVATGVAGLLLVVGGVIFAVWKGAPQISVEPRLDLEGHEIAHVTCKTCAEGTVVEIAKAEVPLKGGTADVPLAAPLHVGDNEVDVLLAAPAGGRKDTVKVMVPVLYRVRTDLGALSSYRPSVSVVVQAVAGSSVEIAGTVVPLDEHGVATKSVDWTRLQLGEADESKLEAQTIKYSVTPPGKPAEPSEVSVRSMVAPLRVDAPIPGSVFAADSFHVSGRTAKGDKVAVNNVEANVTADGVYDVIVPLKSEGELPVEVMTYGQALAPRAVRMTVTRADSLDREAAKRMRKPLADYDVVVKDVAAHVGEAILVEGEVVEARRQGRRVVALVDDTRGCAKGPCIARVVTSDSDGVAKGDTVRAFGKVARPFTSSSGVVPEVLSELTLKVAPPAVAKHGHR